MKTLKKASPPPSSPASPQESASPLRDFSRSLPMALLRAREAVMARFRPTLHAHGLTEQQWRVLRALTASPVPLRLGEIADATFLHLPSLSRLAKTLEARKLIRRAAHVDDLRAAQISLSRTGRALVARIAPLSEASYAGIADSIGDVDLERLYQLLDKVRRKLEQGDESPPAD